MIVYKEILCLDKLFLFDVAKFRGHRSMFSH